MKDKNENLESGNAGQPGEPTAEKRSENLTASSVASLLKSDFASVGDAPAAKAEPSGQETPPDADAVDQAGEDSPQNDDATGDEPPAADTGEENVEGEGEGEGELPATLQTALDQWEQTGGELPAPLQALVSKRIGKLTGQRETEKARADKAEAELQRVAAEAEALRNDPKRPVQAAPVMVLDEANLNLLAQKADQFMAAAENYLDDTATEDERTKMEAFMASERLDANGLKRKIRETSRWLATEMPQQRQQVQQFKAQETAMEPVVKTHFPWLDEKTSPEYAKAAQVQQFMPELRQRTPAHRVAMGMYVIGLEVMEHLNKAGVKADAAAAVREALAKAFPVGQPSAARPKTPPPKAPSGQTAYPGKSKAAKDEPARQAFNKTMTRETAAALLKADM